MLFVKFNSRTIKKALKLPFSRLAHVRVGWPTEPHSEVQIEDSGRAPYSELRTLTHDDVGEWDAGDAGISGFRS